MPDFQKVTGTSFSVSSGLPATQDAAGFQALTFTNIGDCEIISFSGFNTDWSTEQDNTLCDTDSAARKQSRQLGEVTMVLKFDKTSSAFYTILETAELSADDVISCQVNHANGTDFVWFTAQVKMLNRKYGARDDSITYEVSFLQQTTEVYLNA